jgi:uncharacterized protein YcaQ
MSYTKEQLRRFTLSHSLFSPTTLEIAINELGFVQIDPIKSPAPAQDLILRQRVQDYKRGDIERVYEKLGLEEDFLYAHGFMIQDIWKQLHPREIIDLTGSDRKVLEVVRKEEKVSSKDLEAHFGKIAGLTWWGRAGSATNLSLNRLHYYGLIRVLRREKGNRIYQALPKTKNNLTLDQRLRHIVLAMIHIMEPVTVKTFSDSMHRVHRHFGKTKEIIKQLVDDHVLEEQKVDGITYLWKKVDFLDALVPQTVRFLCPFDPVVRDRVRFEQLFGWLYQFEAYVPATKRIRGYYAMPILFGEDMVGWANVKVVKGRLDVDLGFINGKPKVKKFDEDLEKEITRLTTFLHL